MIAAVIFDMDGLLIDSEPLWHIAQTEVFKRHNLLVGDIDQAQHQGSRTIDVVRFYQDMHHNYEHPAQVITEKLVDRVIELVSINKEALPGVYQLIKVLRAHKIPMAVASGSNMRLIEHTLDTLGIRQHLQVVHSAEHEARGKPFPDVFLTTAKLLKVAPANCLVFEDSANGVKAAHAAGMKCVAVPEHPHDPSKFTTADKIVDSLEVVDWPLVERL